MLQELSTPSSQAFFLAWILPFFSALRGTEGLEGLQRRWGMLSARWCRSGTLHGRIPCWSCCCAPARAARLPDPPPSPPRAHQSAPPPPWFWGLTDYIYHTCSSQGNGLNFIQYTPSGSAFKTHPQAHFSLSPCTPAAISHLYSGNKS